MKIRRSRPSIEWTQVPNAVARDYRISWRARGLLVELLSYPPGWETTIDELVKHAQRQAQQTGGQVEGRDAMRAAARELKQFGYLLVHKAQDDRGRWHTSLEVTDAPLWDLLSTSVSPAPTPQTSSTDDGFPVVGVTSGDTHSSPGRTDDGFPVVGSPGVGFPGVNRKTERKTERKKTPPPPPVPQDASAISRTSAEEEGEEEEEATPSQNPSQNPVAVEAAAVEWVTALPWRRQPGQRQRERLAVLVAQAWATGWSVEALRRELTAELEGVRSLYAVWEARLQDLPAPPASAPVSVALRAADGTEARCPRHPGAARRDGECAGCWQDRVLGPEPYEVKAG